MTTENDKSIRTDKEGVSDKDKEQPMDVDKKPCEETTASTQSTTVNRTTEEEPERIVKVRYHVNVFYLNITNLCL